MISAATPSLPPIIVQTLASGYSLLDFVQPFGVGGLLLTLDGRIAERTRYVESVRDLLDAFFRSSNSWLDPDSIDKTFDSVLRFCSKLGYDLAVISLPDREAGVIRAVRATGTIESPHGLG